MADEDITKLGELFGSYKAEYLRERIFELYTRPAYFPGLETNRPCALIGGRGTGKTTVLRSLSYQGRYALSKGQNAVKDWAYYGMYTRVDTNRVTAFAGPDLPDLSWRRLFSHYINILFCSQITDFLKWYRRFVQEAHRLDASACEQVSLSLGIEASSDEAQLEAALKLAKIRFEAYLNNLKAEQLPFISMQAAPLDLLMEAVCSLPQFGGKRFFFIIDEYENFLDDQQTVLNTMVKHIIHSKSAVENSGGGLEIR